MSSVSPLNIEASDISAFDLLDGFARTNSGIRIAPDVRPGRVRTGITLMSTSSWTTSARVRYSAASTRSYSASGDARPAR